MSDNNQNRKPPLERTRDTFIDDANSQENPRVDQFAARHREVRRDKDVTRTLGVTLYDIDFAIGTYINETMKLKVEDHGEFISVPTVYANAEKWASMQANGYLKDKKGKTMIPLVTYRRSGVTMKNELKRNKVATTNQGVAYLMKQKYNKLTPYDRFSVLHGTSHKVPQEYFAVPIPDYVDVTYDFILWCEYQAQLNTLVEQFVYYTGQSFGDRNFFKFATNMDAVTMEDNNTTGQDRVVKATFQITVHAYLLPKEAAGEVTMKRIVSPNKIKFLAEGFGNANDAFIEYDRRDMNDNAGDRLDSLEDALNNLPDISINRSPDVYPTEND